MGLVKHQLRLPWVHGKFVPDGIVVLPNQLLVEVVVVHPARNELTLQVRQGSGDCFKFVAGILYWLRIVFVLIDAGLAVDVGYGILLTWI